MPVPRCQQWSRPWQAEADARDVHLVLGTAAEIPQLMRENEYVALAFRLRAAVHRGHSSPC